MGELKNTEKHTVVLVGGDFQMTWCWPIANYTSEQYSTPYNTEIFLY